MYLLYWLFTTVYSSEVGLVPLFGYIMTKIGKMCFILSSFQIFAFLIYNINKFICFSVDYVDIDYSIWLTCCLAPLVITFLLPAVIALLLYVTAFLLYIYNLHWRTIRQTLQTGDKWDTARKTIGALWDAHGWIWHGKCVFLHT